MPPTNKQTGGGEIHHFFQHFLLPFFAPLSLVFPTLHPWKRKEMVKGVGGETCWEGRWRGAKRRPTGSLYNRTGESEHHTTSKPFSARRAPRCIPAAQEGSQPLSRAKVQRSCCRCAQSAGNMTQCQWSFRKIWFYYFHVYIKVKSQGQQWGFFFFFQLKQWQNRRKLTDFFSLVFFFLLHHHLVFALRHQEYTHTLPSFFSSSFFSSPPRPLPLLFSRLRTAARAGTVLPCRSPPASGAQRAGWRAAGRGGSWRRPGRSRPRSCRPPSACGRRRWWRSCRSRCRSPSSCRLVGVW